MEEQKLSLKETFWWFIDSIGIVGLSCLIIGGILIWNNETKGIILLLFAYLSFWISIKIEKRNNIP